MHSPKSSPASKASWVVPRDHGSNARAVRCQSRGWVVPCELSSAVAHLFQENHFLLIDNSVTVGILFFCWFTRFHAVSSKVVCGVDFAPCGPDYVVLASRRSRVRGHRRV